jgi:acetyltransferase
MYVERLGQIRKFMSAARAVSRIKPIIVLKSGRTEAGARATISRTGAVAHDDALYNLAFQRAGIVRVKTFEELFDCADLLAKQPRPQKTGLIILSNAGGPAVMAVDVLSDYDVEPTALGAETIAQLEKVIPLSWSRANPVDILGDATPERYLAAIDILLTSPETSGLLIMLAPMELTDPATVARVLVERLANQPIPILPVWLGGKAADDGREIFKQAGFPTFNNPERAVRAFMDLYYYGRNIELLQQIPAKLPGRLEYDQSAARSLVTEHLNKDNPWMPEPEAKQLLTAYGIPVNPSYRVADIDEALGFANMLGYPLTLSMDSSHTATILAPDKVMDISDDNQLRQAFAHLKDNAKTIARKTTSRMLSIQKKPAAFDCELVLGIQKDLNFGPVISFGMGGLLGDILQHRALTLPPLNRLLARRMLEQIHFESIISDASTCSLAKFVELEEILIRLGQLATDFAEIAEAKINPLVIIGEAFMVLNVKIRLQRTDAPAPLHLVISPYPNQYEDELDFPGLGNVQLRPIRPEDAPLLQSLFDTLSEQSIYFRFFSPLRQLPQNMLARFTQIDYDREVALVAIKETSDGEQMLGVVRTIQTFDPKLAEFAILVGDQWQGRGIGTALMRRCFKIAKAQGIETIWSSVLAENTQMLALGRKLGFHIERIPDCGEYEMRLELSRLSDE